MLWGMPLYMAPAVGGAVGDAADSHGAAGVAPLADILAASAVVQDTARTQLFYQIRNSSKRQNVPDIKNHAPGAKYLVTDSWHQVPATWCQMPGTWHLALSTWYLVAGTRCLVPGTWY